MVITVKGLGLRKSRAERALLRPTLDDRSRDTRSPEHLLPVPLTPQALPRASPSPHSAPTEEPTPTIPAPSISPAAIPGSAAGELHLHSADAGMHTFSATLNTAGTQSITATDSATATITGSTSVTVYPSGTSAVFIKQDTKPRATGSELWLSRFQYHRRHDQLSQHATVTAAGETNQTWVASTTDPRALENASGIWPYRWVLGL